MSSNISRLQSSQFKCKCVVLKLHEVFQALNGDAVGIVIDVKHIWEPVVYCGLRRVVHFEQLISELTLEYWRLVEVFKEFFRVLYLNSKVLVEILS